MLIVVVDLPGEDEGWWGVPWTCPWTLIPCPRKMWLNTCIRYGGVMSCVLVWNLLGPLWKWVYLKLLAQCRFEMHATCVSWMFNACWTILRMFPVVCHMFHASTLMLNWISEVPTCAHEDATMNYAGCFRVWMCLFISMYIIESNVSIESIES